MLIDFKEIAQANRGGGNQDAFELFSRDFIELIGYEVVSGPARGADGGIDFKVREFRNTQDGTIEFYWLASCKHHAHSGTSVSPDTESNILDRVISNGCQGFIGIYSTLPSNGLTNILQGLTTNGKIEHMIFDCMKIEGRIIGISSLEYLFVRYFPKSYKTWKELYDFNEPIKLFESYLNTNVDKFIAKVFTQSFKSTGNIIKAVRKYNNFTEAVNEHGIELIHDSEFHHYDYRRDAKYIIEAKSLVLMKYTNIKSKYSFKHYLEWPYTPYKYIFKNESKKYNTRHINAYLTGLILPKNKRGHGLIRYDNAKFLNEKVKFKYGITLTPNSALSSLLDFQLNSSLYLFTTLIIADDGHYQLLNELFDEFKSIIS